MRRALALLTLLLLSANVMAVEVDFRSDGNLPPGYGEQVRASVADLLSSRLDGEATVRAHLDEAWQLTLTTDHGALVVALPLSTDEVAATLYSALSWDGVTLFPPRSGGKLSYPFSYGFALSGVESPREGRSYWVVDREGRHLGSVRTMRVVGEEDPVVVAVQSSGRALLPHMGIEGTGTFSFGLYGSLSLDGALGVEALVIQGLPLYPFEARWGIGYGSDESVTLRLGLGATFYMSHLLGTGSTIGRNMALEGWADLALGWHDGLLLSASARLALSYHLSSWTVSASLGSRVAATAATPIHQGLFFTLGTAYTYTP